jgi:hypothetical protein
MIDFAPIAHDYYQKASPACCAAADPILELLSTGFQVTWFQQPSHQLIWHVLLKPHPSIRDQFGLTREYFLIGHGYANDFHQRTLLADPPKDLAFRVDRRVRFVSSSSPLMKDAVASWATERKISIVPIAMTAPQPGAQVDAARRDLYALLQTALWRRDLFDDSEPVRNTSEFFGRENDVDEILGKTLQGQPVALLGLRKIGKSSLLGRVQDLLDEHPSAMILTAFLRCNATRIKSGRWWTLLDLLLREWRNSVSWSTILDSKSG